MENRLITYVFGGKHERQAVDRLRDEIIRTSNEAVTQANALENTIRDMIDRKRRLGGTTNEKSQAKGA